MAQKYPAEFKQEAVDLVKSGTRQADVCRLLGIGNSTISEWVRLDRERNDPARGEEDESVGEELVRLRKQVRSQQLDINILKKSLAFFARETNR